METDTIRVSPEIKKKLRNIGRKGEKDEDIIKNLIELYYDKYGKPQKELDGFHKYPTE